VPNLKFIGAVSTALRFNEIEIQCWCFAVYLFLIEDRIFFKLLRSKVGDSAPSILKFRRTDELVLSCAIFSKIINSQNCDDYSSDKFENNYDQNLESVLDNDSLRLIESLDLDLDIIVKMYQQIKIVIDDPIRIHAIWKIVQRQTHSLGQNATH
jgi:hypothetical protein